MLVAPHLLLSHRTLKLDWNIDIRQSSCTSMQLQARGHEVELQRQYIPDAVVIDYMPSNPCAEKVPFLG